MGCYMCMVIDNFVFFIFVFNVMVVGVRGNCYNIYIFLNYKSIFLVFGKNIIKEKK